MYGSVTEPRGECISWCLGWIDHPDLTHSAFQRDHMLTPCQSEKEENNHAELITI